MRVDCVTNAIGVCRRMVGNNATITWSHAVTTVGNSGSRIVITVTILRCSSSRKEEPRGGSSRNRASTGC